MFHSPNYMEFSFSFFKASLELSYNAPLLHVTLETPFVLQ